jgi:hypothetical protein
VALITNAAEPRSAARDDRDLVIAIDDLGAGVTATSSSTRPGTRAFD